MLQPIVYRCITDQNNGQPLMFLTHCAAEMLLPSRLKQKYGKSEEETEGQYDASV